MEERYDHHQPSSPGVNPIRFKNFIEELLKFTLTSSIDGTLGFDLGLSKEYCLNLLKNDDSGSLDSDTSDFSEGIPTYPLYKRIASALYQSVSFGAFRKPYDQMALIQEDISLNHKEDEWIELVVENGYELLNVLKNVDFELHVQEPFFSQLKDVLYVQLI